MKNESSIYFFKNFILQHRGSPGVVTGLNVKHCYLLGGMSYLLLRQITLFISLCVTYFAVPLVTRRLNYKSATKPCVFTDDSNISLKVITDCIWSMVGGLLPELLTGGLPLTRHPIPQPDTPQTRQTHAPQTRHLRDGCCHGRYTSYCITSNCRQIWRPDQLITMNV